MRTLTNGRYIVEPAHDHLLPHAPRSLLIDPFAAPLNAKGFRPLWQSPSQRQRHRHAPQPPPAHPHAPPPPAAARRRTRVMACSAVVSAPGNVRPIHGCSRARTNAGSFSTALKSVLAPIPITQETPHADQASTCVSFSPKCCRQWGRCLMRPLHLGHINRLDRLIAFSRSPTAKACFITFRMQTPGRPARQPSETFSPRTRRLCLAMPDEQQVRRAPAVAVNRCCRASLLINPPLISAQLDRIRT